MKIKEVFSRMRTWNDIPTMVSSDKIHNIVSSSGTLTGFYFRYGNRENDEAYVYLSFSIKGYIL